MSRTSVRAGVAQLLASLQNGDGSPVFKAVYPVMPTRVDKRLIPAAIVMHARERRRRYGPNQKHADYTVQARLLWSAPSTGWETPTTGNLWAAPDGEPQTEFDAWIDQLARQLEANKAFTQNQPETGVQTIQLGEGGDGIVIETSEPELEGQLVVCAAVVSFPVAEQVLGV